MSAPDKSTARELREENDRLRKALRAVRDEVRAIDGKWDTAAYRIGRLDAVAAAALGEEVW